MIEWWLLLLFAVVAFAYSLVGHGGASGYLAIMALLSFTPALMKPTALVLNLFVSLIAFVQFYRAGHFRWKLFWPFAIVSIPCAFLGGRIDLDPLWYKRLLGLCLVVAALRLFGLFSRRDHAISEPPIVLALFFGAAIGLLSGLLGIGGGILLSPVLLLAAWADAKTAAAVSSLFIFVNSAAGLIGSRSEMAVIDPSMFLWIGATVIGGLLGSWIGARRAPEPRLRQVLGGVMVLASIKLFWP